MNDFLLSIKCWIFDHLKIFFFLFQTVDFNTGKKEEFHRHSGSDFEYLRSRTDFDYLRSRTDFEVNWYIHFIQYGLFISFLLDVFFSFFLTFFFTSKLDLKCCDQLNLFSSFFFFFNSECSFERFSFNLFFLLWMFYIIIL